MQSLCTVTSNNPRTIYLPQRFSFSKFKLFEPSGSPSTLLRMLRRMLSEVEAFVTQGAHEILRHFVPQDDQSRTRVKNTPTGQLFFNFLAALCLIICHSSIAYGQEEEREPMEMTVVVVNPSATKTQTIPIKMYLPMEVTPNDIIDSAGLDIEYDSAKSMYYLYKKEVQLKPSETKTYNVEIRDVWVVPQGRLDSLSDQARSIIDRLEGSEFYESSQLLGDAIDKALDTIAVTQNDEAVSRRTHIGIFRNNLNIVGMVKEDVEQLEKQLEIVRSMPKPEVLERAKLKTESPAKSTSWMIIFIIMLFIGMLAGVFFFTWQTQAHATKNIISDARDSSFPEREDSDDKET